MPLSLSSSSLNSSKYDSKSLRCTSCSQCSETVLTAILIKMLCQNALDLTCSFLCTYFGRCQIHLPPVKHLFLSNCCDSNLGSFFPWYSKLPMLAHGLYCLCLSCSACCKIHFSVVALSLSIFPNFPCTHMDIHLL